MVPFLDVRDLRFLSELWELALLRNITASIIASHFVRLKTFSVSKARALFSFLCDHIILTELRLSAITHQCTTKTIDGTESFAKMGDLFSKKERRTKQKNNLLIVDAGDLEHSNA